MRRLPALILAAALACAPASPPSSPAPRLPTLTLEPQTSGTIALLQAVSAVSDDIAWVSGHQGTWARTLDGGATWQVGSVPGADTLQFRDVHALSADGAYLLSAGTGELSRIYKTLDGGRTWAQQFVNRDPAAFYDCFAFWDAAHGVAYSDAVNGELVLIETANGGRSWTRVGQERLPAALPGEGGFAASGGCVTTITALGVDRGWIATGNARTARVLRTTDRGATWTAAATPLVAGEASGATAVTFRDAYNGVALGGEIGKRDGRGAYVAVTQNGGATWTPGGQPTFAGAVYGGVYVPGAAAPMVIAVGPGGADYSRDDGRSWARLDTLSYWSVGFASPDVGWAVGPRGRITKIRLQ